MKIKHIALTAILLTFLIGSASALPNLKLNEVEYAPNSQRIVAEIINDSDEEAEDFLVAFFVDGKLYDTTSTEQGLSLAANSRITVYTDFSADDNSHYFSASVDPRNNVRESNEEDNKASVRLEGWQETGQEAAQSPSISERQENFMFFVLLAGVIGLIGIFAMYIALKRMVGKLYG